MLWCLQGMFKHSVGSQHYCEKYIMMHLNCANIVTWKYESFDWFHSLTFKAVAGWKNKSEFYWYSHSTKLSTTITDWLKWTGTPSLPELLLLLLLPLFLNFWFCFILFFPSFFFFLLTMCWANLKKIYFPIGIHLVFWLCCAVVLCDLLHSHHMTWMATRGNISMFTSIHHLMFIPL